LASDVKLLARRFLRRLPLAALAAIAVFWAGGSEVFERAMVVAARPILWALERPAPVLRWEGETVTVESSDRPGAESLPGYKNLAPYTGNAVLLLALFWATPGIGTTRGLLTTLGALAVLVVFQGLHFALAVETFVATELSPTAHGRFFREAVSAGRYFFDVALKFALPLVIWGALAAMPRVHEVSGRGR